MKISIAVLILIPFALCAQRPPASGQIVGVSGTGNTSVTTTGPQTPGAAVVIDANGNHVAGSSGGSATHLFGASFGSTASGATPLAATQSIPAILPAGFTAAECDITVVPNDTATFKVYRIATGGTAVPTSGNSLNTSGISISTGGLARVTTLTDFSSLVFAAEDAVVVALTAVGGTATYASFVCHN
jgi:hypothetical protein